MENLDSEIDKRFSHLLASSICKRGSFAALKSDPWPYECDSDDPFDDIHTLPSTPLRQISLSDSEDLPPKKVCNSEKIVGKSIRNIDKTVGKSKSKSVSKSRSTSKKNAILLPRGKSTVTARNNLLNVLNYYRSLDNSAQTTSDNVKSPLGNNSCKTATSLDNVSKATTKSASANSVMSIVSKSPAAFSKSSKIPGKPIPSFKKYDLMKTALKAKKEFEDLIKRIELKKSLKNLPPEDSVSLLEKNSTYGTPVHSSTRIDSLSPTRRPSSGNSTTFVSRLDESSLHETKSSRPGESGTRTVLTKIGIDSLQPGSSKKPPQLMNEKTNSWFSKYQTVDLATRNILKDVVAHVDIRFGRDNRNSGVQAELKSLGARVEKNFTKKVTHCLFLNGKMSTFRKAVETNIPLVTTHWIEACKEQLCQVPAEDPRFLPYNIQRYHDELPLYVLKTKARRPMTDSKITSKPWKKLAERDKAGKPADEPSNKPVEARRPMTDSKITSKPWKKLAERDKAGKPADEQSNKPVEAKRPMTDSKISSKPWKKLVERDKASKPADEPSNKPVEVRRPMTDSKITSKPRKKLAERDKAGKPADEPSNKPVEAGKLEHHTVAGDFRKAQHFDKILKSPILQSSSEETDNAPSDNVEEKQSSRKSRSIRKRIFNSSSDEEGKQDQEKEKSVHEGSMMDDSSFELRISYDSDVLLSDAKKQAATNRFSTPGRLLIARKCKRLLTSCQKPVQNLAKPDTADRQNTAQKQASQSTKKPTAGEESEKESNKQEPKKRKLLMNSQVIPDSTEHTPEVQDVRCLSVATPEGKRVKVGSKQKTAKGAPAPVMSDWESDNSVTRARRESSSLFVKKEKKAAAQRSIPTIVCTRLTSEEVEKVASIVAKLGKFIVEATVTERTTHLITPKPTHTVNLFKGIARGCWVLNVKWVYDSLEADRWLHEEKYEILEFSPSVRQARLERQAFGREFRLELFSSVGAVYVCPSTTPPQADLVELLHLCGATVVSSAHAAHLVVGSVQNLSPTLGKRPPLLVREKWVLDSIKQLTGLDPSDYMQAETSGHQDFKGFA